MKNRSFSVAFGIGLCSLALFSACGEDNHKQSNNNSAGAGAGGIETPIGGASGADTGGRTASNGGASNEGGASDTLIGGLEPGGEVRGPSAITAGKAGTCVIIDGSAQCGLSEVWQVPGASSGATAISAGASHTCVVVDGKVQCWGDPGYEGSQMFVTPDNFVTDVPVDVEGLSENVTDVASGTWHSCAVVGGAAKCWGSNANGQLGNSKAGQGPNPVQVEGLTSGVQRVTAGYMYSCVIVSGAAKCWGDNYYGQLGNDKKNGTTVQVFGLTAGVTDISTCYEHTCAVVNGGATCWGKNDRGQLGNNRTERNSYRPVNVVGLNKGVQAITVGTAHSCALVNGGVLCWGSNESGQLGTGDKVSSSVPVQVTGLTSGVVAIDAGDEYTCALMEDDAVKCWGDD